MPIQYKTIRSMRKTIAIFVTGDGVVEVRAPRYATNAQIQAFVDAKTDWILEKQAFLRARVPQVHAFQPGEHFLYLGEPYPLEIVNHNSPALVFTGKSFRLSRGTHPKGREAFVLWYRKQARELLTRRAAEIARQHNLSYTKIRISSAQTRWGSCSSSGTLSFTWRLVMAPPDAIDYVIVHELAHILHKNHSKLFWAQVAAMQPDYKQRAAWLKENGRKLVSL